MTPAGFLCAFMTCVDLVPQCESPRVRDRLGICEPVRRCYSVRAAYCALADEEAKEERRELLRRAQAEREAGR